MSNFVCIECGSALAINAKACACGWRQYTAIIERPDYRCAYSINQQRCCKAGTISRSCKANGVWYCSQHWNNH